MPNTFPRRVNVPRVRARKDFKDQGPTFLEVILERSHPDLGQRLLEMIWELMMLGEQTRRGVQVMDDGWRLDSSMAASTVA